MNNANTNWSITIRSETYTQDGSKRSFTKRITDNVTDLKTLIPQILPHIFNGCAVEVTTPLHRNVGVVDPDTREFRFVA